MQKTDFGTSDGRGCTVIDLVSRRSMNDMSGAEAESYVLKTASFSVVPPTPGVASCDNCILDCTLQDARGYCLLVSDDSSLDTVP